MNDDQALRSKLIRLAHENPALRKDLLPLVTTAKTAGEAPLDDNAKKAVSELGKLAKLPLKLTGEDGNFEVKTPAGMESLFSNLYIGVRWSNQRGAPVAQVGWNYTHPGGGTNGLSIGWVIFDPAKGAWQYRLNAGGGGYVESSPPDES